MLVTTTSNALIRLKQGTDNRIPLLSFLQLYILLFSYRYTVRYSIHSEFIIFRVIFSLSLRFLSSNRSEFAKELVLLLD